MKAEILILGLLHRGDMHPYEIKRRLKLAHAETYIDFDVGTLYYAVRRLANDGLIEERGRESVGKRAERTIYGLTADGRARFEDLMAETLAGNKKFYHPLFPALLFLPLADQAEAADIVAERAEEIRRNLPATEAFLKAAGEHLSLGMRLGLENAAAHQRVELDWLDKLAFHLRAGDFTDTTTDDTHNKIKSAIEDFVGTLEETGHDR
ncbi:PadR family transcriptional regulator [Kordiimonas gwangyangensis]|uniref:PadR family transcriptional regulator n=1 Tax=Kordiimonas gwangyangensis TaxID=288022 RepID=UPI000365EDCD|nr:PadR family transcriptional regulator [Kordiimonas gwangyangensis]